MSTRKKRIAMVGMGGRAPMFLDPIVKDFRDANELVGICDPNPTRLQYYADQLNGQTNGQKVSTFHSDDFDKMVKQTKADCVAVCTIDAYHHTYIIRALELGADVITEKPMTIDAEKCRAIFDAVKRTGKKVRVTFNYRWGPGPTCVKKIIQEGAIGQIISVNLEYLLNTSHGADYFRRWHREKDKSGGLMVHKATHHFDLVNWWINAVPQTVFGMGQLAFYGRENAEKRGVVVNYDRYTGHDTKDDPFALDMQKHESMRKLYYEAEKHDGYVRDRNVFGDNISIEDTMSVIVRYRTGAVLNYSLNAFMPREGFNVAINGTKGRIEYRESHGSHIIAGQSSNELAKDMQWDNKLVVLPLFDKPYEVDIPQAEGGHGGGDPLLQEQMFSANPPEEPYHRNAGHGQGGASILIGIAANESFKTGQSVQINKLCPQIGNAIHLSELA